MEQFGLPWPIIFGVIDKGEYHNYLENITTFWQKILDTSQHLVAVQLSSFCGKTIIFCLVCPYRRMSKHVFPIKAEVGLEVPADCKEGIVMRSFQMW